MGYFSARFWNARYWTANTFQHGIPTGPAIVPVVVVVSAPQLTLNGRDVADFKMIAGDPHGFMGPSAPAMHLVPVIGRAGSIRISGEGEIAPRRFTVECLIRAGTQAERDALWDAFVTWVMADGGVEVRFGTWPDREGVAWCEGMTPGWLEGPNQGQKFTLGFVMPDPHKYAIQADVYAIASGTEAELLLGSAASDVRLQLVGKGLPAPRVLYKDAQGMIRGDISFAATPVAGTWYDFNWDGYQLARRTDIAIDSYLASDNNEIVPTRLFVADPQDADAYQGPTLTASNADVVATLIRAWK